MKFNIKDAFIGLAIIIAIYLTAGIGVIIIDGPKYILLDHLYLRLGAFLGTIAFIIFGLLKGLLFDSEVRK